MGCFWVLEAGEGIEGMIYRRLRALNRTAPVCFDRERPSLLVVSQEASRRGVALPDCRTVLLPGEAGELLGANHAASAVSYGPSPRDTLTLSSREGTRLWAALQRELVTVEGRVVEPQEFPLALENGAPSMSVLAAAGALLLLGVPPEQISQA